MLYKYLYVFLFDNPSCHSLFLALEPLPSLFSPTILRESLLRLATNDLLVYYMAGNKISRVYESIPLVQHTHPFSRLCFLFVLYSYILSPPPLRSLSPLSLCHLIFNAHDPNDDGVGPLLSYYILFKVALSNSIYYFPYMGIL